MTRPKFVHRGTHALPPSKTAHSSARRTYPTRHALAHKHTHALVINSHTDTEASLAKATPPPVIMQSIELSFESETSLSEGHDKAEEESRSSSPPLDGDSKNLAKKAKVECDIANECYNRGQEATTEEKRKNYFIKSVKYATMAAEKGLGEREVVRI